MYSYQNWVSDYHDGEVHAYWVEESDSVVVVEGDTIWFVQKLIGEKDGDTIHIGFIETMPNGIICFSALKGVGGNGTCAWYAPMAVIGADFSGDGDEVYLIDSIFMNDQYRKRWHTLRDNVIIEGIGSLNRMPMSYPYIGNVYAELLCFSVHDSLIYQSPKYKTCDTSWHINLSNSQSGPNARNARFFQVENGWQISLPVEWHSHELTLELFDVNGRKLKTVNIGRQADKISNSGLTTGMYVYRISSSSEEKQRGKLLKP